jgi:molybdate transport system substrate-binding protein
VNITALVDLTRAGVKLVLGAEGVPIGDYAREALAAAGLNEALDQVVSLEEAVKGVLGKVALGEADAGIVYATDARAAGDDVRSFPVPQRYQPEIRYYAAVVAPGEQARAYLELLLGDEGRAALDRAGFLPASA